MLTVKVSSSLTVQKIPLLIAQCVSVGSRIRNSDNIGVSLPGGTVVDWKSIPTEGGSLYSGPEAVTTWEYGPGLAIFYDFKKATNSVFW